MPNSYLLQDGTLPAVAIYSSCEDVLLAQAEVLTLRDTAIKKYPGRQIRGYFDVSDLTIAQFKAGYRGRHDDYVRLMAHRSRIIKEGWTYPECKS